MKKYHGYVVMGTSGEYADHIEWIVSVHLSRKAAERKILKLDTILAQYPEVPDRDFPNFMRVEDEMGLMRALKDAGDLNVRYMYGGITYYIVETIVED